MSRFGWQPSTEPGFENLVERTCLVLEDDHYVEMPVFSGWRRTHDNYENIIVKDDDGKHKWTTRDKT